MKLKCLDSGSYWLTPGKIYDGETYYHTDNLFDWVITNDLGVRHAVEGHLFIPISKWREEQVEKLEV